jgi:hypothetical protein
MRIIVSWKFPRGSYKNFSEFCELYCNVALSHYELSLRAREFPYTQNVEQEDKAREYHRKKREIGKNVSSHRDDHGKQKHSLSHLSDYALETEAHNQIWQDAPAEYQDMPDAVYDSDDSISVASHEDDDWQLIIKRNLP